MAGADRRIWQADVGRFVSPQGNRATVPLDIQGGLHRSGQNQHFHDARVSTPIGDFLANPRAAAYSVTNLPLRRMDAGRCEFPMTASVDRRSPHVSRVPLTKLVDICPTVGESAAFQGQSGNVSGRGMSLRTSHLPDLGQELVCRFEHKGQEILVEGRVAWRAETEEGGEFGLQFTALDADSTDVIRELGRSRAPEKALPPPAPESEPGQTKELAAGHRVRLHVEGLGAPMKAAVHTATERRIRVGSQLEFLKVGRNVELEELGLGTRRSARVDSVNVVINPATSIPELVVQLKYAGLVDTPAPARAELGGAEAASRAEAHEDAEFQEPAETDEGLAEDLLLPLPPKAAELGRRALGWARRASTLAGQAGATLSQVALEAKEGAARALERGDRSSAQEAPAASHSAAQAARRRMQGTRRPGAGAPAHLRSGIHELGLTGREKKPRTSSAPAPASRRFSPRLLGGIALVPLVLVGSALATRALTSEPPAASTSEIKAPEAKVAAGPAAPVQQAPAPLANPPANPDGIALDVPLFGPRSVATSEPVSGAPEVDDATAEKLAAAAAVPDQAWGEDAETAAPKATTAKETTPWGRGKLHLPTIHRIRLDAPGAEIAGAVEQEGFVVVIPGRKAMESGRAIQGRDKRILKVMASNTAEGARVRFSFRGAVPAYRVRLRNDFIEFLISAPEDSLAKL